MSPGQPKDLLSIFLCHSSGDKPAVRELYDRLSKGGFAPWFDAVKLLPSQDWRTEIGKAVRKSDVVLVCLSNHSLVKEGFVQKEIKMVLDLADEKPPETIFIIPVKLEPCEMPERLSQWQWVNYSEPEGYERLVQALAVRAAQLDSPSSAPPTLGRTTRSRMVLQEIRHRVECFNALDQAEFTYTEFHTAQAALVGKSESHPRVGKLGTFGPLFEDFEDQTLFALVWELAETSVEGDLLRDSLKAARALPHILARKIMVAPVGERDSVWRFDPATAEKFRHSVMALAACLPPSGE